ncbi:MAG TPA: hypothetical protein VMZ27_12535 [Candidatus Saccharimonadales bacterium]|nr:hypothetical protein [Candidatus Saccharimonadales bacterium]
MNSAHLSGVKGTADAFIRGFLSLSSSCLAILCCCPFAGAAVYVENFASNPSLRSWHAFGQANLFQWDSFNENVNVTWDSSQPNSFFYWNLGTVLTKTDDFSFSFDLRLKDIQFGASPGRSNTFQIAAGLMNFRSATNSNYYRGAGTSATYGVKNIVEWDFFPDDGYGATWATTVVSTNNRWLPAHNFPLELTPGAFYRISVSYTASNQTLVTRATKNGAAYGLPPDNSLQSLILSSQPDFRLDTFAIMSYSDTIQIGPTSDWGSILAHGVVDNISISVPAPPLGLLAIKRTNSTPRIEFSSKTNWQYTLERTTNLLSWTAANNPSNGNGSLLSLQDSNSASAKGFYRIRAERP